MNDDQRISIKKLKNDKENRRSDIRYIKKVCDDFIKNTELRFMLRPPLGKNPESYDILVDMFKRHRIIEDNGDVTSANDICPASLYSCLFGKTAKRIDIDTASCLAALGETPAMARSKRNHDPKGIKLAKITPPPDSEEYRTQKQGYYKFMLPFISLSIEDFFRYITLLSPSFMALYNVYFHEYNQKYIEENGCPATIADLLTNSDQMAYQAMNINPDTFNTMLDNMIHSCLPLNILSKLFDTDIENLVFIRAYLQISTIMVDGMRLINAYADKSFEEIMGIKLKDHEPSNELGINVKEESTVDINKLCAIECEEQYQEYLNSLSRDEYLDAIGIDSKTGLPKDYFNIPVE